MGEAARPLRGRRAGPPSQQPRPVRSVGADDGSDLARLIAEQFGKGPVHEVKTVVYRRPPHDMLGADGYSLVSNYFLRRVLPYCLMHNIISKLQAAVLSNMIGRQKKGKIYATHAEIADEIGVKRTSIGHALDALCEKNLVRKAKRSSYQLNPRVAYNGNGQEQRDFLAELRALALESKFPDELAPELSLFPRSEVG
ncbi:replication/maintenance protein RepL [Streptomyces massasporeus]|jgi:predicted transcriptional regulator|uniref:replication/maintenance protein RepL n=1 Tax=Streptomyces massasporeus TaxID=67324 RepID=UPI0033DD3CF1